MAQNQHEIAIIPQLQEQGMEIKEANKLLADYGLPLERVGELIIAAEGIEVKDESDTEAMAAARETRLELRTHRIAFEKKHDELKADSLAYGRAVDLVQRVGLGMMKPVEDKLLDLEKTAERMEEARRNARIAERTAKLEKYTDDVSLYNFADMADDAFQMLVDQVKFAYEARLAKEKEEQEAEAARIKAEEEARVAAQKKAEDEAKKARAKAAKEAEARKAAEAKLTAERAEQAKKDKEAADKLAAAEAEKQKLVDAENARKAAEEKAEAERIAAEQRKAEEEAEAARIAAAAPDKEKLIDLVNGLELFAPDLSTTAAINLYNKISVHLDTVKKQYLEAIEKGL